MKTKLSKIIKAVIKALVFILTSTKVTKALTLILAGGAVVAILYGYTQHWLTLVMFLAVWLFLKIIDSDIEEKRKDYYE